MAPTRAGHGARLPTQDYIEPPNDSTCVASRTIISRTVCYLAVRAVISHNASCWRVGTQFPATLQTLSLDSRVADKIAEYMEGGRARTSGSQRERGGGGRQRDREREKGRDWGMECRPIEVYVRPSVRFTSRYKKTRASSDSIVNP